MRVITKRTLVEYYTKHPETKDALEVWYDNITKLDIKDFNELRTKFANSVDYIGNDRYVFNIKGNNFRLIVIILFIPGLTYIRFVGTHAEYDKIKDASKV